MSDLILKVVLPTAGLIIILFCIGAYFFKYGSHLKDSVQEIKMLGADMRISIITVFVLVGLIFVFAGTYFNIVNTNSKLAKMLEDENQRGLSYQTEKIRLEAQVNTLKISQNKTLSYFIDLDGVDNIPDVKNLKISYKLWGDEDKENLLSCSLTTQNDKQRLSITISDLDPKSFITALLVEDVSTKHKWKMNSFYPLSPSLKLSSVN